MCVNLVHISLFVRQEYTLQARMAPPFSVAPPVVPAASADNGAPPSALASLDVNGLLLTAGQVYSSQLGTSVLRPLLPYPFLSDAYTPQSDRWDGTAFGLATVEDVIKCVPVPVCVCSSVCVRCVGWVFVPACARM